MKKNNIIFSTLIVIALIGLLLVGSYLIGSGFIVRADVGLLDYSVSEDGTEITFSTHVLSSMGYTRGFKDNGGRVKPHYLTFYSTFGGINSTLGAKDKHVLMLDSNDSEIYFNRADGGYELILQKDKETGEWIRP